MKTLTLVVALFFPILLGFGVTSAAGQEARTASAAPTVAPAPTAASTADQDGHTTDIQSYVGWFLRSSGIIGLFILILTIYFLVTVVRLNSSLRREVAAPPEQLEHLQDLLRERDHRGVVAYARANDSYLCRVLTLGVLELPNGLPQAQDAMERHGEVEAVEMENRISMLAVLGTLGPMIGLIGTLKGMIASFSVIATSGVQLRTSEVAGGISEALLLTFEGVALSVPAIYFFAVFRNRVSSISVWTMLHADTLLRQFSSSLRQKSNASSTSGPTSAAA
jgi:biopolymer transport protein ExbB